MNTNPGWNKYNWSKSCCVTFFEGCSYFVTNVLYYMNSCVVDLYTYTCMFIQFNNTLQFIDLIAEIENKLLKEHCTQKKIWIHLMQNIFRNQTVKNLTILDNPFKRYDFSKFSLNSVKSLCRPHKLATVPCHGCTTPHWFCTQIITNFQFSWIWVKLLIKLIPKSMYLQIHIYPKQTWLISRGNLMFTWELYF